MLIYRMWRQFKQTLFKEMGNWVLYQITVINSVTFSWRFWEEYCLSSGCRNKTPQTGGFNSEHLFPTVLEAESPKSGYKHGWVLMRTLYQAHCVHTRWRGLLSQLFSQGHEPHHEGPTLMTWGPHLQRPHLWRPSHGGLELQHTDFGKTQIFGP